MRKVVGVLTVLSVPFVGVVAPAAAADPPATIELTATVRDFEKCAAINAVACHPDFETFSGTDKGIVTGTLGADGKPVYANPGGTTPTTSGKANFDQWYRDVPGVNIVVPVTLTATLVEGSDPPIHEYRNQTYFPLDGLGWEDQSVFPGTRPPFIHNFHFTTELHTEFVYNGGETFEFVGDDDLFVYVNGRLVIDLGGVHSAQGASVDLDEVASTLGLLVGNTYSFDLFGAERHTTASTFGFRTSIRFLQDPTVAVTGVADGASYELGSVPTPGCSATDEEGEAVSPAPTPSVGAVTGPLVAVGLGSQTVTCTYSSATASATYDIVTTQPPTLAAHDDVHVEIDPELSSGPVTFDPPAATDPHGLPFSVVCTPPSGSTFALGTTTVSCVATNIAGLSSSTVTFDVVVSRRPAAQTVLTLLPMVRGNLAAQLTTADGDPVVGRTITFTISGRVACVAVTDADGRATCSGVGGVRASLTGYTATFAGDPRYLPSSASGGLGGLGLF